MTRPWDVVIVGARVAGASTALLLARAGLRVLCIDRARHGSDTVSTHALMRAGVLQLSRWGLLEAVRDAGTPPIRRITFHSEDEPVVVPVRPSYGVDALFAPRRTLLDTLLVDAAVRAGATFRYGTAVTGLLRDGDSRVTGVVTAGRDGRVGEERAALVIGADGRSSVVADAVRAPNLYTGSTASAVLYGYWAELPVDGYEWYYRSGVSAGAIPTNDSLTAIFVGGRPGDIADLVRAHGPEGAVRAAVAPGLLAPVLAAGRRATGVRYVRGVPAHLRRASGPGWALVGDAGHFKDPLGAHGMTDALRDAEFLADAIGRLTSGRVAPHEALAAYQDTRDALSHRFFTALDEVATYGWDLDHLRILLVELSHAMGNEVAALTQLDDKARTAA
jgi:2-polyprenyl-6-methoxyphenol hydroxylase-like FAD-dependent oxidoreductase